MKRQSVGNTATQYQKKKIKYFSDIKLKEISSIFLSSKKHANLLIDVLNQFKKPSQTPPECVSAVENIFVETLKRKDMAISDTENMSEAENQYKTWLRDCYEDAWAKLCLCLRKGNPECKLQTFNSLFNLLSVEAKFPIKRLKKKKNKNNFPVYRLKEILKSLSQSQSLNEEVLKRVSELLNYKDVQSNVWLSLDELCKEVCDRQPEDKAIWNILLVLAQLPKAKKGSEVVLCDIKSGVPEERFIKSSVQNLWKQLSPWQYSPPTRQLLLVVLVEHMMPVMDNAIYLTDYFMDALSSEEYEISMIALQGIFNLVIKHNIEYPDIFGKLYQLFTSEALKAKYKARLFALADEFLRSTHLPLALVAGFAKRYSRLLISASPPDQLVLLASTVNLLIRHPDLKFLYHNPDGKCVQDDPYDEQEKDPVKSGAMQSQLWEVKLMQHHYSERVAKLAMFISHELPSVEYELDPLLDISWDKMIKKQIKPLKKNISQVAEKFQDKAHSSKTEEIRKSELKVLFSDFNSLFVC